MTSPVDPDQPSAAGVASSPQGDAAGSAAHEVDEAEPRGPLREARADDTAVPTFDDGDTVVLQLSAEPPAVSTARRFITQRWSWLDAGTLDDVELIVAELVSNAVRHGRPEIELRLRVEPFALDVAVLDHGDGTVPAEPTLSGATARSGRGLAIVDGLSRAWGVEPLDGAIGKYVWASIARP